MAHFTADFLPLTGNDMFDMRGEMPPQLRVYLDVPEGGDEEIFNAKINDKDVSRRRWFRNMDKLKEIILQRYRNAGQHALTGFRQQYANSIISIYHQQTQLAYGVDMQYTVMWGREYVTIRINSKVVHEMVEEAKGGEETYMLVLYHEQPANGVYNLIAAIPMNQVDPENKVLNPFIKKKKLDSSNWERMRGGGVQFKFADNRHILLTGVKFSSDGVVTSAIPHNAIYNTAYSLLDGEIDRNAYVDNWNQYVMMNGDSSVVHTVNGNAFTFDSKGKPLFSGNSSIRPNGVLAISAGGTYYGGADCDATSPWQAPGVHFFTVGGPLHDGDFAIIDATREAAVNKDPLYQWYGGYWCAGAGGITCAFHTSIEYQHNFYCTSPYSFANFSGGGETAVMVYENDGKFDRVTLEPCGFSYSIFRDWSDGERTETGSVSGKSYKYTSAGRWKYVHHPEWVGYGNDPRLGPNEFSCGWDNRDVTDRSAFVTMGGYYSVKGKPIRHSISFATTDLRTNYTPFKTYEEKLIGNSGVEDDIDPGDRLICNGKHYLFAVWFWRPSTGTRQRWYLDGEDWTDVLMSALDLKDEDQIDQIFFDIKLNDILKLK